MNELLVRQKLLITEYSTYCICPRCYCPLPRDYVAYCDRCGQSLKWQSMKKVKYVSWEEIKERIRKDNLPKSKTNEKPIIAKE